MNGSTWSAFRAMVWKEWRENAPWALLAALGLSLGVVYNVTQKYGDRVFLYGAKDFTGYWEGIHTVMAVGPLVVAVGFAFLQIFSEQRRDQWAFLIHRPASRSTFFWGKALAGLSLVLAATAAPLLGAAAWAAIPGHLAAPFDLDLCTGEFRGIAVASLAYSRSSSARVAPISSRQTLDFRSSAAMGPCWRRCRGQSAIPRDCQWVAALLRMSIETR